MQFTTENSKDPVLSTISELIKNSKLIEARNALFVELKNENSSGLAAQLLEFINVTSNLTKSRHNLNGIARCDEELLVSPENADVHYQRGHHLWALNRAEEALESYKRAVAIREKFLQARLAVSRVQLYLNHSIDALSSIEAVLKEQPNNAEANFLSCRAELRVVYKSQNELRECRRRYREKLQKLAALFSTGQLEGDLVKAVSEAQPFHLPYQGLVDRKLQAVYGSLMCEIITKTLPEARLSALPAPGERLKVGIVSACFFQHTNWKLLIKGWLSQLDQKRFRLFGYHVGNFCDSETIAAARSCERFLFFNQDANAARKEILVDKPDALIYPGLSMDSVSWQLAAQRLAPVQCNSWGHPETSGLPSMDYFLSSSLMEPSDAATHYSEKLVPFPNLGIFYTPSHSSLAAIDESNGTVSRKIKFWSGQFLSKYLPKFDFIFAEIAKELESCEFIFSARPHEEAGRQFMSRLERAFSAKGLCVKKYCTVLPRSPREEFLNLMGQCDIILDSVGWSGGITTLESLVHNLPIVTCKGQLMRGRHTAAILERMMVKSTIAETVEDYISIAVDLAKNPRKRSAVSQQIARNKAFVYDDRECIRALEEFIENAVRSSDGFLEGSRCLS
jgi:predicted O-linked N-acetylglucosamine transferase (SPINDLY family)